MNANYAQKNLWVKAGLDCVLYFRLYLYSSINYYSFPLFTHYLIDKQNQISLNSHTRRKHPQLWAFKKSMQPQKAKLDTKNIINNTIKIEKF